jgi:uncharacterized protein (TIGR02391 family)
MPILSVQKQLAHLLAQMHKLLSRVREGAPTEELRLRKSDAVEALNTVRTMIGADRTGAFCSTNQHISALIYYYKKKQPHSYESDINDLYEDDLPGVVSAVETWLEDQIDPRLLRAVRKSWDDQRYGNAVRDAFICLETVLRTTAELDGSAGLSGDKLVTAAFAPERSLVGRIPSDGFMGQLTNGEVKGLEYLVRGAFLLFRNATAHREIAYSAGEAEGVINIVNQCLRFMPAEL